MDDPFVKIDADAYKTELRLIERGQEHGALNLPAPDTQTLDSVEADIIARINEHYSRAQIDAANQTRTYRERLANLALLSELSSISAQGRIAVGDFGAEVINCRNNLATSRDAIRDSYDELKAFRHEHGLKRPAHPSPPGVATWGAIILAWLGETVANTFLLRMNDAMGLLGGFVAAAIVSFLNVVVAAFIGRLVWPHTHYREGSRRVMAWAAIALWIVFLVGWNLLAAHFRDAKSSGVMAPETVALNLFADRTFTLDSVYSWGLLIAGIIFSITAAIAAYRMDDPYPGYGAVSRRHHERCEDYSNEIRAATEELQSIRGDVVDEIESVRAELRSQVRERNQVQAGVEALRTRFDEHGVELEQVANSLLETYRMENRKSRSEPAPAHFNQRWHLKRSQLPDFVIDHTPAPELKAADSTLEQVVAQIADSFDGAIQSFESLDALKRKLTDGAA